MKSCGITAHRDIPNSKINQIEQEVREAVFNSLQNGYRHFVSGFARGGDLIFIEIVLEFLQDYPDITIEAAIPYAGRLKTRDPLFQRLIFKCDKVEICSQEYSKWCYSVRNDYIINNSEKLIVIYDGRKNGGTYNTMKKAERLNKDIVIIDY